MTLLPQVHQRPPDLVEWVAAAERRERLRRSVVAVMIGLVLGFGLAVGMLLLSLV